MKARWTTDKLNARILRRGSILRVGDSTPVASPIITATVAPALSGTLVHGQDTTYVAALYSAGLADTANYASTAGTIDSVGVVLVINGGDFGGGEPLELEEGDQVHVRVTVTDSAANTREYSTNTLTVAALVFEAFVTPALSDVLTADHDTFDIPTAFSAGLDSASNYSSNAGAIESVTVQIDIGNGWEDFPEPAVDLEEDDTVQVRVSVTDAAGNVETWDTNTLTVDASPLDSDATAYIAAVETADGEPLEAGVKDAIYAFIVGLKADGLWTTIDQAAILACARTLSGALVPLRGAAPTNVNFVSDDYNRLTGLKGNGSNKRLTGSLPGHTQNDASAGVYFGESYTPTTTEGFIGNGTTGNGTCHIAATTTAALIRITILNASPGGTPAYAGAYSGFFGGSRTVSTDVGYRLNGATSTVASSSAAVAGSNSFNVFCRGNTGAPSSYTSARLAFFWHGDALDLAALEARLDALFAAVEDALTEPLLLSLSAEGTSDTTAQVTFTASPVGATIHWSVRDTEPALGDLLDGTGSDDFGSLPATAGPDVDTIEGLTAETGYPVWAVVEHGGEYSEIASTTFETLEEPTVLALTVEAAATGPTTAQIDFTAPVGAEVFRYLSTSGTPPSLTDLKAGTGATLDYAASFVQTTDAVPFTGPEGLTASTTYYVHAACSLGSEDSDIETATFTTPAVDSTPAVLSDASAAAYDPTSGEMKVTVDKAGGILFAIATKDDTTPTDEQIEDALDGTAAAAEWAAGLGGGQAVTEAGEQTVVAIELDADPHYGFFVYKDAAGFSNVIGTGAFTPADVTKAELSSLEIAETSQTTFGGNINVTEAGTLDIVLVDSADDPPDEDQIIAGDDANDDPAPGRLEAFVVAEPGHITFTGGVVTDGGSFRGYATFRDAAGNKSVPLACPYVVNMIGPVSEHDLDFFFSEGEEGFLYDVSDLSTLWRQSDRSAAVTEDGQTVRRIDDLSGNGHHMAEETGAWTYRTSGGLHWIEKAAAAPAMLDMKGTRVWVTSNWYIALATRIINAGTSGYASILGSGGNNNSTNSFGAYARSSGTRSFRAAMRPAAGSIYEASASFATLDTDFTAEAWHESNTMNARINGGTPGSAAATLSGTPGTSRLSIGNAVHQMRFYGGAGVIRAALTDEKTTARGWASALRGA